MKEGGGRQAEWAESRKVRMGELKGVDSGGSRPG